MTKRREQTSFSAYSGMSETPMDFAPIRAEIRHARRDGEGIENVTPARRGKLRFWMILVIVIAVSGVTINHYRGVVADFIASKVDSLPAVDIPGIDLADIRLPEFRRPVINRAINTVRLESPLHHVTEAEVRTLLARYTDSGFLGVDVQELREELERNPWVSYASVRRVWPDVLVVRIEEEKPVAHWGTGSLINEAGKVFTAPLRETLSGLPALAGPQGTEALVLNQYRVFGERLESLDLHIAGLSVDSRGSWRMTLAQGPELRLGREEIDTRLKRFMDMYASDLKSQLVAAQTIDLRYSNGFSISTPETGADSVASR